MDKVNSDSKKIIDDNIVQLSQIIPECISEGKIDFDKFKALFGEYIDDSNERFGLTWNGKNKSLQISQSLSTNILRPVIDKSVNWDKTNNVYIEGDNLEVLKILQKSYNRKIKMIYIDPPYNTGNDFVYNDSYEDSIASYKEQTNQENKANPETSGRFHTEWLNMMYPRLRLAKNLLKDDGIIFISIDDGELKNLLSICDEVFGKKNYIATIPWRKRTAKSDVPFGVSQDYEWIVCFAKSSNFKASVKGKERKYYETPDFPGRPWRIHDMTKQTTASERPNSFFTMVNPKNGDEYPCDPNRTWRITKDTFKKYYDNNEIVFPGDYSFLNISKPVARYFKDKDMEKDGEDFGRVALSTKLPDDIGMSQDGTKEIKELFNNIVFPFPKPTKLIKYLLSSSLKDDDIVLDFFSGSATTADAIMQLNAEDGGIRKFIMVQLPEICNETSDAYKQGFKTICDIGEERIRRAGKKIKEENGMLADNLDIGFKVFKLDSSNIKIWNGDNLDINNANEYFYEHMDPIVEGRTDVDLLYEILLKEGMMLSSPVEEKIINDKKIYSVGLGYMIVCLDNNIDVELVREIGKLKPETVIFKDSGFSDENAKANALQELKKLGIDEEKVKSI